MYWYHLECVGSQELYTTVCDHTNLKVMGNKICTIPNGKAGMKRFTWTGEIPLYYSPRLVWSLWLWLSGFVTIHEPSCDRDAKLA